MKYTCKKEYADIPFAHRQHEHQGHCALIHGHNWSFVLHFTAETLDPNGFVVDFGDLKFIKNDLLALFDHALVLNQDDPHLDTFLRELEPQFAQITVVPNCGAEGLAKFVLDLTNQALQMSKSSDWDDRGLRCFKVEVREDSKNSATCEE